jgi:glycosyltransferase involved in cell wall biosynthesis
MVRDEADIIEEAVRSMFAQGIDRVVLLDHGSEDETPKILNQLARELPLTVLHDPTPGYMQSAKTTMLARAAASGGASWVVPFDADELWFGVDGRAVADVLRSTTANVIRAEWYLFVPVKSVDAHCYAERFPYRVAQPSDAVKVAFRANWLALVRAGNHAVFTACPRFSGGLRIAHYSVRTPEQVAKRAHQGAAALRADGTGLDMNPRWADLEDADAAEAERYLTRLLGSRELVFDPASLWAKHQ